MTSAPVLAVVFAILAGGLALVCGGAIGLLQWLRVRRRGARPGQVHLTGRGEPIGDERINATVSGEAALCSQWRLEREEGRVTRPVWRTVEGASDAAAFELEADGDRVHLEPEGADFDLADDLERTVAEPADLPDAIGDRLADEPAWDDDARYRLVEARIEAGDRLSVSGRLSTGVDGEPTVAGPADPSLLGRLFGVPFVVADADRDGGAGRLRDRAIAGFVLGLPPTLLAIVLLFPPEIGG